MKVPKFHSYSGTARLRDPVISYSLLQRSSLDQPTCHFCSTSNDIYPLLYARSIFLIPKPPRRVRHLAPQGFQLQRWPGKMREVCNTTALGYFPGVCPSVRHTRTHAGRRLLCCPLLSDAVSVVSSVGALAPGGRTPPEEGQGSARPCLARFPVSPSPPGRPRALPCPGHAVGGASRTAELCRVLAASPGEYLSG